MSDETPPNDEYTAADRSKVSAPHQVYVRLTPEEWGQLKEEAQRCFRSASGQASYMLVAQLRSLVDKRA